VSYHTLQNKLSDHSAFGGWWPERCRIKVDGVHQKKPEPSERAVMTTQDERPTPPGDCECCESGCSTCVWDSYFEELSAWNARQAEARKTVEQQAEEA